MNLKKKKSKAEHFHRAIKQNHDKHFVPSLTNRTRTDQMPEGNLCAKVNDLRYCWSYFIRPFIIIASDARGKDQVTQARFPGRHVIISRRVVPNDYYSMRDCRYRWGLNIYMLGYISPGTWVHSYRNG